MLQKRRYNVGRGITGEYAQILMTYLKTNIDIYNLRKHEWTNGWTYLIKKTKMEETTWKSTFYWQVWFALAVLNNLKDDKIAYN